MIEPLTLAAFSGIGVALVGQAIALATFFQAREAAKHALLASAKAADALHAALLANSNVQSLDVKVDGRLTELLAASIGEARGEGHAAGREEIKAEVAAGIIAPLPTPGTLQS